MAQIKIAEYTFDNSVGDVMPSLTPNTISMTKEDSVSGTTTRRIVYIDNATMPIELRFNQSGGGYNSSLLTVEYLNIDSNITKLDMCFYRCQKLQRVNTSNWNTSNVTNFARFCDGCDSLVEIDISHFNVGKANGAFYRMFNGVKAEVLDVSKWNVDTTDGSLNSMFSSCPNVKKLDLSNWKVKIVHTTGTDTSIANMFNGCSSLEHLDLSGFDFSEMNASMNKMFCDCSSLREIKGIETWDVSKVTNFSFMFQKCSSLTKLNLRNWVTSSATTMQGMFHSCSSLTEIKGIENFNVSSVTSFGSMFYLCKSLTKLDLRNWVTSSATTFQDMFNSCSSLEVIRVDNFVTSKVTGTGLNGMFSDCKKVKTLNLNSFVNAGLGNFLNFCYKCESLEYISAQNFIWGNCNAMQGAFTNCKNLKMLDLTNFDGTTIAAANLRLVDSFNNITCPIYYNSNTCTANDTELTNKSNAIDVKGRLMAVYDFDNTVTTSDSAYPVLTGSTVTKTIDTQGSESHITHRVIGVDVMPTAIKFNSIPGLLNVDYLAVTNVTTSLHNLFSNCIRMSYVNTFGWDTQNVTTMETAFGMCSSLTELDLSSCNLQNLQHLYATFSDCSNLETLHLPTTFTTKLISLGRTFWHCSKLSVVTGLSEIDTSKVVNFDGTFRDATSLMEIDLSKWNTSSATGSDNMFSGCTSNQIVYIHDTNWTISTSSYNATFIRILSTLLAKYTFDNSIGDCLPTITGITTSDYKVSDIVNGTITTRLLSTDSDKTITQYVFSASAIANNKSLLTLDYLKIDNNITSLHNLLQNCDKLVSVNAENWDTSSVTSMGYFLQACGSLIEVKGLGSFNTSKVTNLSGALQVHKLTNIQEISNWDISNCTNFAYLFSTSTLTGELDLSNWSPAKAENMQNMFALTNLTSINLSGWNVPKLNNMSSMFVGHNTNSLISVNMSNWTMETPANMNSMFYNNPNLTSIDFTGSKMISSDLQQTFRSCTKLTSLDVSGFDTSQCKNINVIFADCAKLTEINGLENWDVSKVVNMNQVFSNCTVLANLDNISNWNTSEARYMYGIFSSCKGLTSLNINGWDVSKATTLQGCFSDLVMDSLDLSNWNVSQVNTFSFLFSGTKIKNINVSGWDTSAGTNFQYLFTSSTEFEEVDLSSWKVSSDANLHVAFNGCSTNQTIYYDPLLWQGSRQENITWTVRPSKNNGYWLDMTGITGATEITLYNENNLPTEEILTDWGDGTQDSELTHTYSTAGEYIVVSNLQMGASLQNIGNYTTKAVIYYYTNPSDLFFGFNKMTEAVLTDHYVELVNEKKPTKFNRMFYSTKLPKLPDNLNKIDTSSATSMNQMFYSFQSLTEQDIDLTWMNVSSVTDMSGMFEWSTTIKSLNTTGWDTSKVQNMSSMFHGAKGLTNLDLSHWDTSSCTNMSGMFNEASALTSLDVSSWNFEKCTAINQFIRQTTNLVDFNMSGVTFGATGVNFQNFAYQSGVQNVNMSNITTAGKVSFESPFYGCSKLKTIDFSNSHFKPNGMQNMFYGCKELTSLDLSSWDTSQCTSMKQMFSGCNAITSINMSGWNTANVIDMGDMFRNTTSLQVLDVSNWDVSSVNSTTGSISYMFTNTRIKHLDLSSWKITDDIKYCSYVFLDNPNLEQIDLSNWLVTQLQTYHFRGSSKLKTIGMLYSSAESINKLVASGFNNYRDGLTIYYYDADPSQLTPVEGVTFKKYQTPTTIQLPPHIQLHSLPDGTRDEVDIKTGILTHNTGECTWNDSTVGWGVSIGEGSTTFYHLGDWGVPNYGTIQQDMNLPLEVNGNNTIVISPNVIGIEVWGNAEARKMNIHVPMKFNNENEAKQWLKENQVTFIYRKETPTTEQLILNYNNSCDYGRILPTGMCDKYDVVNSMYTQTMTSILLDGTNTWDAMEEFENTVKFTATGTTVGVEELNMLGAGGLYCDNDLFPNINDDSDVPHCRVDEAGNKFYIYVDKEMLMSPDLIGWQIWLQANNFNLIYELAEHLTYVKPYEELDATQARWEGMDCMRDGAIRYHTNSSDNITMYPTLEYVAPSINNFEVTMLEPNTDYTIYAEGINTNDTINLGGTDINFKNGTVYTSGDNQWLRIDNNDSFYNMVITKGDTTGEVVPYFEGMTSVENPKVITPTKNLALIKQDEYIVPDSEVNVNVKNDGKIYLMGNAGSSYVTWDLATGKRIFGNTMHDLRTLQLEPGTYTITSTLDASQATGLNSGNTISLIVCADGKYVHNHGAYYETSINNFTNKVLKTTVTVENYFSCILIQRWYTGSCDGFVASIQIEKGNTATNFAPAGGSTVSYTDLKLRSLPNGVKDTVNVLTGEYVQRIGEIVLDGSDDEDWVINGYNGPNVQNTVGFQISVPNMKKEALSSIINNRIPSLNVNNSINYIVGMCVIVRDNIPALHIRLSSEITGNNLLTFKQWLAKNSVTVQYELAEPIITKLDPQTLLAYTDGTINLSSDTGLLPTTHYSVPSTNTFNLASMKTGTRYTLKYPSASGSITIGDINYSISSDSMLFTTPLKINGDTSAIIFSDANPENVILLEGAYNKREVPFFTGVKSVKNPNITIIDQLSTESTTYNCETEIELRGLPNGVADKLDIIKGKLTTNVGIRPYQEGDENLPNIWTDGYETVYALSSPVVKNVIIDRPTVTTNSLIELSSDYLIPQLNYRAPSSNNFPLDLLQPNTTYTLYADTLTSGSYTLGGTRTGVYSQPHTIILGDMTDNLLTFNGDLGLSNVMLVKGNSLKTSLPPYFLGIRSVTDGHLLVEGMAGEMNEITFDEGIVLRDCNGVKDTIDLIACTLTKRTGEITLTGAEGWYRADNESTTDYNVFKLTLGGLKEALVMCDTLQSVFDTKMMDCIHAHTNELCIVIANATIGGNTVNALKSWLNQHPTTVVYQLRVPIEVQLENVWTTTPPTSYDNQTEISSTVSTNSLKPMISVTIATTTLEEIVSNLEAQNAELENENMATMLALTSVYELMSTPSVATTETQVATYGGMSVSPMGMVYARLVSKGFKTIEEVPYNLQAEVMYALRGME